MDAVEAPVATPFEIIGILKSCFREKFGTPRQSLLAKTATVLRLRTDTQLQKKERRTPPRRAAVAALLFAGSLSASAALIEHPNQIHAPREIYVEKLRPGDLGRILDRHGVAFVPPKVFLPEFDREKFSLASRAVRPGGKYSQIDFPYPEVPGIGSDFMRCVRPLIAGILRELANSPDPENVHVDGNVLLRHFNETDWDIPPHHDPQYLSVSMSDEDDATMFAGAAEGEKFWIARAPAKHLAIWNSIERAERRRAAPTIHFSLNGFVELRALLLFFLRSPDPVDEGRVDAVRQLLSSNHPFYIQIYDWWRSRRQEPGR